MKIGIDIDGVIIDFERTLKTYAELYDYTYLHKNGLMNKNENYIINRYDWTKEEHDIFMNKYFVAITKKSPIIPGVKEVVELLKKDQHKLIIISARGLDNDEMINVAKEKMEKEGLFFDQYFYKQSNKLDIILKENIDIMIDDSYEVCQKLSTNHIKCLYLRDKNMKKIKDNPYVKEVSNWGEIYRIIKEYEND